MNNNKCIKRGTQKYLHSGWLCADWSVFDDGERIKLVKIRVDVGVGVDAIKLTFKCAFSNS